MKKGCSHELAALLLTEAICYATLTRHPPVGAVPGQASSLGHGPQGARDIWGLCCSRVQGKPELALHGQQIIFKADLSPVLFNTDGSHP